MPLLSSVADVKRVLGLDMADTSVDAALTIALTVADRLVRRRLKVKFETGNQSITFYNVPANGRLALPLAGISVVSVTSSSGYSISFANQGDHLRLASFDTGYLEYYDAVTVVVTPGEIVPDDLKLGVAMLTAEIYLKQQGDPEDKIVSERIGDYSYTLERSFAGSANKDEDSVTLRKKLLAPYVGVSRVLVV